LSAGSGWALGPENRGASFPLMPGRGEGFTPRSEPLGLRSRPRVVGSAPPLSLPGRSRDGSILTGILVRMRRGDLGHTLLQGLRASTLEDFARSPPLGEQCGLSFAVIG
jgi:hypothetical protein